MKTVLEAANTAKQIRDEALRRALSGPSSTVSDMASTDNTLFFFSNTGGTSITTPTITWTTNLIAAADGEENDRPKWEGILALEGHPTSDMRYLMPNEIDYRALPIPLLAQSQTAMGHDGANISGRIEEISFIPIAEFDRRDEYDLADVRDETIVIWATGTYDPSEHGDEAQRLVDNGAGVSVDLTVSKVYILDPETFEEVPEDEIDFEMLFFGGYVFGYAATIAGATIVAIPAFEQAEVDEVEDEPVEGAGLEQNSTHQTIVASAFMPKERRLMINSNYGIHNMGTTLTASAAGLAPLKPPAEWFSMPEPMEPTPLTVTKDGRVFGHLALWNQCHTGFAFCERPPQSRSGYSFFHVGQVETEEGDLVNVGRVTVGEAGRAKGGHASIVLGRQGAMDHYDKTGCVGAFVRATNGTHGIWLSGAVRSDAPAETVRDMRANPPSGDWRDGELVAVLSVPVPGFPIPRAEARMVASGATEEIPVLIASGYSPESDEAVEESQQLDLVSYRKRMLRIQAHAKLTLAHARGEVFSIENQDGEVVGYSINPPNEELSKAATLLLERDDPETVELTADPVVVETEPKKPVRRKGQLLSRSNAEYISGKKVKISLSDTDFKMPEKKRVHRKAKAA